MRYPTILLALLCVACGSYSANVPTIKPYKMDIQQGNVITPKMMMQLRPGMSKSQVRFIMGTPLLVDSFHADRWDYFYQMRKQGRIIEQRRVILEFSGDTLAHVRGDVIPAGSDASSMPVTPAAMPQGDQTKPAVKAAPQQKEKGLLDKLKFWESDEKDASKPQPRPVEPPKVESRPMTEPAPELAVEPAPAEAPLPPLMDEAQQAKPETQPVVKPVEPPKAEPKPAPAPEPAVESAPAEAPLPPLMDEAQQAKPETKPAVPQEKPIQPPAKPVEQPRVEPKPQAPAPKPQPQPDAKPKLPPQPAELPPEDAPDFFEKMLEKIGF